MGCSSASRASATLEAMVASDWRTPRRHGGCTSSEEEMLAAARGAAARASVRLSSARLSRLLPGAAARSATRLEMDSACFAISLRCALSCFCTRSRASAALAGSMALALPALDCCGSRTDGA